MGAWVGGWVGGCWVGDGARLAGALDGAVGETVGPVPGAGAVDVGPPLVAGVGVGLGVPRPEPLSVPVARPTVVPPPDSRPASPDSGLPAAASIPVITPRDSANAAADQP